MMTDDSMMTVWVRKGLRNYKISSYQRYVLSFERRVPLSLPSLYFPSCIHTAFFPSRLYTPSIIIFPYVTPVFACTFVRLPVCLIPYYLHCNFHLYPKSNFLCEKKCIHKNQKNPIIFTYNFFKAQILRALYRNKNGILHF